MSASVAATVRSPRRTGTPARRGVGQPAPDLGGVVAHPESPKPALEHAGRLRRTANW
jgi:hypothetical protein